MRRRTGRATHALVLAGCLLGLELLTTTASQAHKAITSKYHFNEDLFPVFREHCGRCHVDGGVAPMSLMTYDDAAPWAESLRLELLNEATPAWHPLTLTARELDMVLVWASGGAPRGSVDRAPPPVALVNTWASGPPDVTVPLPAPFTLTASANEATHDAVLPLTSATGREVSAIDLLPGTPAIVRSAVLLLKTPDGKEQALGSWIPGRVSAVALKAPIRVNAGSVLVARISYKRTWKYRGQDLTDRSTIGLYSAGGGASRSRVSPRAPR